MTMPNKNSIESEIEEILTRLIADIDDDMEFIGTAWKPKEHAVESVSSDLTKAKNAIMTTIQREVKKGRVEELKRLDKETKTHVYVETDGYLKDRLEELEG